MGPDRTAGRGRGLDTLTSQAAVAGCSSGLDRRLARHHRPGRIRRQRIGGEVPVRRSLFSGRTDAARKQGFRYCAGLGAPHFHAGAFLTLEHRRWPGRRKRRNDRSRHISRELAGRGRRAGIARLCRVAAAYPLDRYTPLRVAILSPPATHPSGTGVESGRNRRVRGFGADSGKVHYPARPREKLRTEGFCP